MNIIKIYFYMDGCAVRADNISPYEVVGHQVAAHSDVRRYNLSLQSVPPSDEGGGGVSRRRERKREILMPYII
ncbi:MAG: hypothetical protein LUF33_02930 [Clostridiales bacterium]|nr:hypothetical protein [Clostridiales bacterium]